MDRGHDYVGSIRRQRQDSAFRRYASLAMNWMRERITKIRMTDQGCMLRAYDRQIVDAITSSHEINTFIPALAYTYAANPTEIEVAHEERAAGESKYSLYSLLRLNFDLVTGFSIVPLQVFSLLGMAVAVLSVLTYIVVIIERWILADSVAEGVLALWDRDILQFFLTGLVLFGLGLLGEYIGRIYQQVRSRPRFLIQAILERKE
jgi:undecaprenyl-phosphate 4-deoxy-4-formamido-L-arabinose transferase